MAYRLFDFIIDFRVDLIQEAGKNRFAGLPNDSQNHNRNKEPNDRIRKGITQGDTDGPQKHGQTGKAVYSGVMTVHDQGRAADFLPGLMRSLATASFPMNPITDAAADGSQRYRTPLGMQRAVIGWLTLARDHGG